MAPQDPPEPTRDVIALNTAVSTLKRQMRSLEERDHANGERIGELAQTITDIAKMLEKQEANNAVWNWAAMSCSDAADAWEELLTWRREVFKVRWPDSWAATTAPCWYKHPQVVEELTILYLTWRTAVTGPEASPRKIADWADRLPNVVRRIQDRLTPCSQQHKELWVDGNWDNPPPKDHDDEELSEFIADDLDGRQGEESQQANRVVTSL